MDTRCKSIQTLGEVVTSFPYSLTPSVDVYGVGLLIMVLLSEKMPFSNVPYEEGVRGQLLANSPPRISSNYNDYTALCSLEPHMYQCLGNPEDRRPVVELIPVVESLYCDLDHAQQEDLLRQRNEEIAAVQKESREISKKLKDHVQLVTKGREMIARKDVRNTVNVYSLPSPRLYSFTHLFLRLYHSGRQDTDPRAEGAKGARARAGEGASEAAGL